MADAAFGRLNALCPGASDGVVAGTYARPGLAGAKAVPLADDAPTIRVTAADGAVREYTARIDTATARVAFDTKAAAMRGAATGPSFECGLTYAAQIHALAARAGMDPRKPQGAPAAFVTFRETARGVEGSDDTWVAVVSVRGWTVPVAALSEGCKVVMVWRG